MFEFKNNPFIRILIPFVFGIFICTANQVSVNAAIPLLILLTAVVILFLKGRKIISKQSKWLYILVCDIFLFTSGLQCCYLYNVKNNSNYYGYYVTGQKQRWVGKVLDLPVEKERSFKVLMDVCALENEPVTEGKVLVYFKKPVDINYFKPGNKLSVNSSFNLIPDPQNPHEFDYRTFLLRKNIYYQGFVEPKEVELKELPSGFSLINFGLRIKQAIINRFKSSELDPVSAQLCIALLTGYDDDISPQTINAFAHSGTLHVLSVSGLHTGIVYAVLVFLLSIFDKNKKYKLLWLIIITVVLWLFVLITGFSPPVLRAAVMLNLIALGRSYYGYNSGHAVNILAVSAFVLLVFNPLLIYDTGFLLSYSAVAGILYFEPTFTGLVNSRYFLINKTWQLTSVSLAAQVSTLPITLFLFHQFPVWFVVSNLIVIPLCIAVMFLACLILLKLYFVVPLINLCISIIFYTIHLTDGPGIGYLDKIDFEISDALFLSAFIVMMAYFIRQKTYSYALGSLLLLVVWQLNSLFEVAAKKEISLIGIYQVNKQTGVDVKNRNRLYFYSDADQNNYNYHIKNNHCPYNYPTIDTVRYNYVRTERTSLLKINDPLQQILIKYLRPEYLLVTNNVELNENYLRGTRLKLLVADGSNNYEGIKKLKALCGKFAIPFYSTREKGYFEVNL